MIQKADTVGVFQIESRAQMSMLPRLKPKEFYDLVIEVAIVRPGPIQGDMVHPYLRRRNGEEPVEYAHPAIEEVLGKTLGVPLFQEQCMALAIKAAGFTPGEADQLRRAMAAWKRKGDQIYRFGQRLIEGMVERGIPRDFAERCFEQIKGFSEYGFPESHAASFALIVYASAWLKRHHPAEFCAALINSQPMGFYAPAQLVRDAREHGVDVRAIDVNFSGWDCRMEEGKDGVEVPGCQGVGGKQVHASAATPPHLDTSAPLSPDPAVRLGMRLVRGLSERDARKIEEAVEASARAGRGRFTSMLALWRASGASAAGMRRLAAADALGSMGLSRQQALWQARLLRDEPLPLFDGVAGAAVEGAGERARANERAPTEARAPVLAPPEERGGLNSLPVLAPVRQVALDYGSTGLSLKAHPVSFVRPRLRDLRVIPCTHLRDAALTPEGEVVRVAGLVLVRQRPGTAKDVTFMTIEDETAIANLVIWSRTYDKFRREARGRLLVAIGRVQRQGEVVHVVVSRLKNFDQALGEMPVASRDFH